MNEEIATEEEVNAAFESGASDDEPVIAAPAKDEPKPEAAAEIETPATPEPAPQAANPLTPEILAALSSLPNLEKRLTQQVDKVAGNYGEVKRLLDTIQKSNTATPQGAAAATDAWNELQEEFGPELAGQLAKAVDKVVASRQGISQDDVRAIVAETVGGNAPDLSVLDDLHPDWKELRDTKPQDYSDWLASLRPATRIRYLQSSDPLHVAEKLDEFKEWREARTEKPVPVIPPKEAHQASTSRLEAATTPTGRSRGSPTTLSAADAFLQAAGEA